MQALNVSALQRAEWQPALFAEPNRARLAECVGDWPCRTIRLRVHRNHGIESVASATVPYAAWNGLAFEWTIGPYDDTLFFSLQGVADVELVWLDTGRQAGLADAGLASWLVARLRALRAQTSNPIVVLAWPLDAAAGDRVRQAAISGVYLADLEPLAAALGARWQDRRTESISGTRLSNRACLLVARALACRWIPAAVLPPVKCLALDLDGTLYDGVLGEDGVAGVKLTEGHKVLHEYLAEVTRGGMLLALVSRNELVDVEELFAQRSDFPLRLEDFSAIEVSWGDKAAALARIAQRLRIGLDAVVLVDDNPGELASVAAACPATTVHARPDGRETVAALSHVAGVFRWHASNEDHLRADDLRASVEREALQQHAVSPDEYLRSLAVRLQYHVGAREHLTRMAELVGKTNQFNLPLRRMNETEIAQRAEQHPGNVIAFELADRLSDSGIVGVVVGGYQGGKLRVEELSVSCRALGRRLEDSMLTQALLLMAEGREPVEVSFDICDGPRNGPARQWLAAYAGIELAADTRSVSIPFAVVRSKIISDAIAINTPEVVA